MDAGLRLHNTPMSDVMPRIQVSAQWRSFVQPISRLFQSVPVSSGSVVLLILQSEEAREAICAAARAVDCECVEISANAAQADVEQAIVQHLPVVVVCVPEIFGWVSKTAFVAGSAAVYTCGEHSQGTLLARAAHFVA